MAIKKGMTAPDVELLTMNEGQLENVRLSELRGKSVVLLFFPLAGTGVCTEEMCEVTEDWDAYQRLNATVFGISADSPFAQRLWTKASDITVPMLSDFNHSAVEAFGIVDDDFALNGIVQQGIAKRSAIVIDPSGTVVYAEILENPGMKPDFDEVKRQLESLSQSV